VEYLRETQGIVFVVDAADRYQFDEAKDELQVGQYQTVAPRHDTLSSQNLQTLLARIRDMGTYTPVLVLGTKTDIRGAVTERQLKATLGLDYYCTGKVSACRLSGTFCSDLTQPSQEAWQLEERVQPIEVFMSSALHWESEANGTVPGLHTAPDLQACSWQPWPKTGAITLL
jgi:hypothetical protein